MARKRKNAGNRFSDRKKTKRNKSKRFLRGHPTSDKREIRQKLKTIFGGCCQMCGYDRTFKALEFHHVNAKHKESSVSKMVAMAGYKGALEEALKCILVCANCHREIEAGLLEVPREIVKNQIATVINNLSQNSHERSDQSA